RQVADSELDAVERQRAREVDAVVDPELAGPALEAAEAFLGETRELRVGARLGAQLNGLDSGFGHLRDRAGKATGAQPLEIGDRVDRARTPRGARAHPLSAPARRATNPSRKRVENRPERKTGSRNTSRWSGIEVLMPSMTKKSRARRMRAIASA